MRPAALASAIVLCGFLASDGAQPRRPNVVLFVVDDMGWMDCGAYGSQYYETPHIDRLAARGMLFTNAYSANPLCSPTRASILTGKYPARLGITTAAGHQPPLPKDAPRYPETAPPNRATIQPQSLRFLNPEEYTLAEALRDAGYRTGHFGKWHLGLTEEFWPERQGFDVAWHGKPDPGPPSPNGYFSPYSFQAGTITPGADGEYIVDRLTDEVLKFIDANREGPFYANVWQFGVHGPWGHKQEYTRGFVGKKDPRGQQGNPIMASMLKSIDESLGRIVARLDELGLADDTIVIFTSDNGGNVHSNTREDRRKGNVAPGNRRWESLESYRRYAGYLPPTNNHPLRAGKGTLYEGGVRIPLVVVWPGKIPAGTRSDELVGTFDFYPTLLELLGLSAREGQTIDGVSIARVLADPRQRLEREAVFNFFPHGGAGRPPGVTVRQGDWKLIRWYETGPDYPAPQELYNLKDDLGETTNLAAGHPEIVARLDGLIDQFLEHTGALAPKPNPAHKPSAVRAPDPLLGWVAKSCEATLQGQSLRIEAEGRWPFIATVRARALGALELHARLRTDSGGEGKVQWRTAGQEAFPADGQVAAYTVTEGGWQQLRVALPVKGQLAHVRFYVPAQQGACEIDWIELRSGDSGETVERWNFGEAAQDAGTR